MIPARVLAGQDLPDDFSAVTLREVWWASQMLARQNVPKSLAPSERAWLLWKVFHKTEERQLKFFDGFFRAKLMPVAGSKDEAVVEPDRSTGPTGLDLKAMMADLKAELELERI